VSIDKIPPGIDPGWRRITQLPDEVASYVRELIMSGRVRAGDFLRVTRVAEAIGVSSTPVREGLVALCNEGLVVQVPRRGFVVAPFTPQDIRDLFWAQGQLAGELAARAAPRITRQQLSRAERIVAAYEEAVAAEEYEAVAGLGHAFHREINLAAESIRLATLLGAVVRRLPQRFYLTIEGGIAAALEEHPHLLSALRDKDAREARSVMEQHISGGADRLIETLERRGLWAEAPAG
jgi:DNA-binding GntR family transcriptional regulator